ncbi:MAG: hypothetical protein JKY95_14875 [Planctomycetaceae bacterium]|nr:hypothetical protein [Planctomycetaceae bacterium]
MGFWDLTIFIVVCLLLLGGSFRAASSGNEFLVADRKVGFFPLLATLVMTEFNTATLLAFAAMGYVVGPRAVALSAVFLIGLGWYTLTVARKWKEYNGISVAGWFTLRYGKSLGRTASLLLLLATSGFSATYVKSLTLLLQPTFSSISPWLLSGLLCLLIASVTISGGLQSVVRLDVLGFLLTVIMFPFLLWRGWMNSGTGLLAETANWNYWSAWNDPALPWWFIVSLMVLTCLTYICSPWYGQKIFAAADEKTAVRAVGAASVIVFFLYACVQLGASLLAIEVKDLSDPQLAVPMMIQQWLPLGVQGLAFAVLFAVATTTLAGAWSAMVAMTVNDFNWHWESDIQKQRLLTLIFATISWAGCNLLVDDILNRLILANIPIAALSFALLGGFYWAGTSRVGAWCSLIIGIFWGGFCFIFWGEAGGYTWPWTIYGTPLIFSVGVIASRLFPDPPLRYNVIEQQLSRPSSIR